MASSALVSSVGLAGAFAGKGLANAAIAPVSSLLFSRCPLFEARFLLRLLQLPSASIHSNFRLITWILSAQGGIEE